MESSFLGQILDILKRYWPSLALGIQNTLIISLSGTLIGLCIGLIVGGIRAIRLDYTASPAAVFGKTELLPLRDAEGRIAAEQIAPYPPGVPVVAPGERITKMHLAYLTEIGYNSFNEDICVVEDGSSPRP